MTIICMVGLGKLGLPVATTFAARGNQVYGYDSDAAKSDQYRSGVSGLYEPGIDDLLKEQLQRRRLHICTDLQSAVRTAEVIFVAVPTPSRQDHSFETLYVKEALTQVAEVLPQDGYRVIALISTVLPGSCRNEFLPLLEEKLGPIGERYGFCYNAQFIAMGTVIENTLTPEFVLIGEQDKRAGDVLESFYRYTIPATKNYARMSLENAEVVKCTYNNLISLKIVYANTLMEMCDSIPHANCDVVSAALSLSTDRLLSPKYLRGGLGDGGGCHPRDNRALSFLSKQLGLSVDPFQFVTQAREAQSENLAAKIATIRAECRLPVKILGVTFKPRTNLTEDSPALLLYQQLKDFGIDPELYDPLAPGYTTDSNTTDPRLYVIGTAHEDFLTYLFVHGSVIVDPWGLLTEAPEGCGLISVGRWQ